MKKILITFLIAFCLTSCVEEFKGNYGVVENIELVHPYNNEEPEWKFKVTVSHQGSVTNQYIVFTNDVYHPGDTIEIGLKKHYEPVIIVEQPKQEPESKKDTIIKQSCETIDEIYHIEFE